MGFEPGKRRATLGNFRRFETNLEEMEEGIPTRVLGRVSGSEPGLGAWEPGLGGVSPTCL